MNKTYPGCDRRIRAAELKTANGTIEQPVQFLYPLKLECDGKSAMKEPSQLNPNTSQFGPKRTAATAAKAWIEQIIEMEENEI